MERPIDLRQQAAPLRLAGDDGGADRGGRARSVLRYAVRQAVFSVLIIHGFMLLLFFMTHIVGDPHPPLQLPGEYIPEEVDALRKKLGYDRSLASQFAHYYWGVLTLDFGNSVRNGIPAMDLAVDSIPDTAYLIAVPWAVGLLGIPIGMLAAWRPRSILASLVNASTLAAISVPSFWLALMLILVFGVFLNWLPFTDHGGIPGDTGWNNVWYVILPVAALSPYLIGRVVLISWAVTLDEAGKRYVLVARARGLSERAILCGHVLRNAAIAVVRQLDEDLAFLVGGLVVVEVLFAWPGLGLLFYYGVNDRDLSVLTTSAFVFALIIRGMNVMFDVTYRLLDPRVGFR